MKTKPHRRIPRKPRLTPPEVRSMFAIPATMLEGMSASSPKARLWAMLRHAVTVAEAWKSHAQQAQAQEQRTYLAFVKATRGPQ